MTPIPTDGSAVDWARDVLGHDVTAEVARSHPDHAVHRLTWPGGSAFLKVAGDLEPERARLEWAADRILVPRVLGFAREDGADRLLMAALAGTDLADLCPTRDTGRVVRALADGLRSLHATDVTDCPFGERGPDAVLVHGDACLPNVVVHDDGGLSGYLDLGDLRAGDREVDLAAAVWSLHHNLGAGHGLAFLRAYGVPDADEAVVDRLRASY